jgi:hypothetical protein
MDKARGPGRAEYQDRQRETSNEQSVAKTFRHSSHLPAFVGIPGNPWDSNVNRDSISTLVICPKSAMTTFAPIAN